MRYSIVHHDVRQKFDLTIAECIVADSISKLCRLGSNGTTHKSNVEIGKFIGFSEISVRRAKESLLQKGLIFEMLNGVGTTPLWEENNTFFENQGRQNVEGNRQNVERNRQNVEDTTIININTLANAEKEDSNSKIIEIPVDGNGDAREKIVKQKADTRYLEIFALWGKYPANWRMNRTQIQAAKNLLEEHSIEQIRGALKFHRENSEHEYCPSITSPYDLDSKWKKLSAFKKKYG